MLDSGAEGPGFITFRQACSYPRNPQEGCYQFCCLVNRGTMGVNSLPRTVTRQRRGCDLNPGPSAPESSTLTTRLPSDLPQNYVRRRLAKKELNDTTQPDPWVDPIHGQHWSRMHSAGHRQSVVRLTRCKFSHRSRIRQDRLSPAAVTLLWHLNSI